MFELPQQIQKNLSIKHNYNNFYQNSFFKPYKSLTEAKHNLKAIVFRPLVDTYLLLTTLQRALFTIGLGITNIALGIVTIDSTDLKSGGDALSDGAEALLNCIYYAQSIVTNCIDAILRLITHTLSTIGYGLGIVDDTNTHARESRINVA